ncbi:hypothetical protein SAMN03159341_1195 [Paenibacillus sp. 1_12]|uniref:hypothetical protein n=1 Tax=Paenibacillus sp. 1_12 TaxID=1566278 RepID=UPI0008EF22E0|nr:hypothetical protein [Paenibacillus sp. 1_12]SFM16838.1 hypothetical protein SAMN03159341_1195 [Paenibacillus sp. 1_12]
MNWILIAILSWLGIGFIIGIKAAFIDPLDGDRMKEIQQKMSSLGEREFSEKSVKNFKKRNSIPIILISSLLGLVALYINIRKSLRTK